MEQDPRAIPWHGLPVTAVTARLAVDAGLGLTGVETIRRLERYGPNSVDTRRGPGPLARLFFQLRQPLVAILLGSGIMAALIGQPVDAGVITGVVVVNVLMGFFQEAKAVSALAALKRTLAPSATVLRDGVWSRIEARELVPGDVVALEAGDKVPADVRLIAASALRLDESALTGESVPVDKTVSPVPAATVLAERACLAFATTVVVHGRGRGIVIGTGQAAEIGHIASLTATAQPLATPLTRTIEHFSRTLLFGILLLAGLALAIGTWRGQAPADVFMTAVALAVGAIPEGLPAAVTVILAMGVTRMARRRAIIRHLPAVETLGAATVICTDKTGTLTENRMTVVEVFTAGRLWQRGPQGFVPADSLAPSPPDQDALRACLRAGLLCNDAVETQPPAATEQTAGTPLWAGDPTETALLQAAREIGLVRADEENRLPRLDEAPFASEHRFMATLHDAGPSAPRRLLFKGSVEAALTRCPGGCRETFQTAAEAMGRRGLRVLTLAERELPAGTMRLAPEALTDGLTLLGLVGLLDPPRPEAAAAVTACRRAGILVKMITGDQPSTAAAIGRQVGLGDGDPAGVVTGLALEATTDAELPQIAVATAIFARVSPEQKLRLVRALTSLGLVTAMTGDGINDAPALRQADIGVAMGARGSEAAREAADMVLADDNFATLAAAVEEGRAVRDNLTKYIVWTLPANLGEGLVILAALLANVPLPISPVQILWINMTTAGSLGLMLAFEPREPGLMDRPPLNAHQPILNGALIRRVILVGLILLASSFGLFFRELAMGSSLEVARTVAVNVFVATLALYLLNCRALTRPALRLPLWGNPAILAGMAGALGLQALFTYAPFMQELFGAAAIPATSWLWIAGTAIAGFCLVELEKRLFVHP
ncbi:MAG: cation-translocating P-type ATPase [Desulfovibrionaceae bacterium]